MYDTFLKSAFEELNYGIEAIKKEMQNYFQNNYKEHVELNYKISEC